MLDGRRVGHGARMNWSPWPGRHELTLLGADGRTLQTVRFEVRGAVVRSAGTWPLTAADTNDLRDFVAAAAAESRWLVGIEPGT
mgnify:CR=1 FL=1